MNLPERAAHREWKIQRHSIGSQQQTSTRSLSPPLETVHLVNLKRHQSGAARESLKGLDCVIREHGSAAEALEQVLAGEASVVIVSEMEGAALCRAIRSSTAHQLLPVIVVGETYTSSAEVQMLEAGADAYLSGALNASVLRARMQSCLRRKTLTDSMDETETVLFTLAHSVEERDPALSQHCERLSFMAATTGLALGLGPADIVTLQRGGFLHDVGKVGLPDCVLFKPGPLTAEEWEIMKTHTERGERICAPVRSLAPVLPIIRSHHEKWDGTGYPDGLRGDEIPLLARIMQMADIYDALTTPRPYKRAFASEEALSMMREEVKKGWRDPELSRVFFDLVPYFDEPQRMPLTQLSLSAFASSVGLNRNVGISSAGQPRNLESRLVSGL